MFFLKKKKKSAKELYKKVLFEPNVEAQLLQGKASFWACLTSGFFLLCLLQMPRPPRWVIFL